MSKGIICINCSLSYCVIYSHYHFFSSISHDFNTFFQSRLFSERTILHPIGFLRIIVDWQKAWQNVSVIFMNFPSFAFSLFYCLFTSHLSFPNSQPFVFLLITGVFQPTPNSLNRWLAGRNQMCSESLSNIMTLA